MTAPVDKGEGEIGFQVAPMVDVVFVLMLFFMACAGAQKVEREMRVDLPGGGDSISCPGLIAIDISAEGLVSMNNEPYGHPLDANLTALRGWLSNALSTFGDKDPIIIRPSPAARHERIIQVLNAITGAAIEDPANPGQKMNFKKLSFS